MSQTYRGSLPARSARRFGDLVTLACCSVAVCCVRFGFDPLADPHPQTTSKQAAYRNGDVVLLDVRFEPGVQLPVKLAVDWSPIDSGSPAPVELGPTAESIVLEHQLSTINTREDGDYSIPITSIGALRRQTSRVKLRLDNTAPQLELGVEDGAVISQGDLQLRATSRDPGSGVARVEIVLDDQALACDAASSDETWSCAPVTVAPGRHQLVAQAQDGVGNVRELRRSFAAVAPPGIADVFDDSSPTPGFHGLVSAGLLGIGWGDFGQVGSTTPDGRLDLLFAGQPDQPRLLFGSAPVFSPAAYVADGSGYGVGILRAISVGRWTPEGRVEAFSATSGNGHEAFYQWHGASAGYLDLASDSVVPEDNALLAGPSDWVEESTTNLALFDYDNDGDVDLYRLRGNEPILGQKDVDNQLLTNVGATAGVWRFAEIGSGEEAAVAAGREGRGLLLHDLDLDGRDDVLVTSLVTSLFLNRTTTADLPSFVRYRPAWATSAAPFNPLDGDLIHGATAVDHDNDGDPDLLLLPYHGQHPLLFYRNAATSGEFALTPVATNEWGIDDVVQKTAAFAGDVDNDGDLDLYVTSESNPTNPQATGECFLLRNDLIVDGKLSSSSTPAFSVATPNVLKRIGYHTYAAAFHDHDGDGDLDLLISGWSGSPEYLQLLRNRYYEKGGTFYYYRVRVRVDGRVNPLGTKVVVRYGPHRQLQQLTSVVGFGSSPSPDLHFGTGPHDRVDVDVYLPGRSLAAGPSRTFNARAASNRPGLFDLLDLTR